MLLFFDASYGLGMGPPRDRNFVVNLGRHRCARNDDRSEPCAKKNGPTIDAASPPGKKPIPNGILNGRCLWAAGDGHGNTMAKPD